MSDKDIEQQIKSKGLTAARVTLDDFKENIVNTEIVKHVFRIRSGTPLGRTDHEKWFCCYWQTLMLSLFRKR